MPTEPGNMKQLRLFTANTHFKQGLAHILWVPRHKNILENEKADQKAKRNAKLFPKLHTRHMLVAGAKH